MGERIDFSRDERGRLVGVASSAHFKQLSSQLTSDIGDYAPDCLELLQVMDEVRRGEKPVEEYEGNSAVFRATPSGVTVQSLAPSGRSTSYTFEEARAGILDLFNFLAPTPGDKQGAVARWENEFGRPYPGRAEFGLS